MQQTGFMNLRCSKGAASNRQSLLLLLGCTFITFTLVIYRSASTQKTEYVDQIPTLPNFRPQELLLSNTPSIKSYTSDNLSLDYETRAEVSFNSSRNASLEVVYPDGRLCDTCLQGKVLGAVNPGRFSLDNLANTSITTSVKIGQNFNLLEKELLENFPEPEILENKSNKTFVNDYNLLHLLI